ncbi:MAG TPA: hypothetical protein ENJ37_03875 [Deltaproteobacteria bacterium]|nr:hypothetical protein [Deltaproteobacteria bacterium]
MPDVIYNSFKKDIMNGSIDLGADTIKVMLVDSSYVPDQDLHTVKSDVTGEVTGAGYTAGGAALANKTVTQDNVDNEGVFDADDVTWANSTITARGAVLYKDTGAPSTSPLICYMDFGADKTSSGGDFTIQWNAEGIVNLT